MSKGRPRGKMSRFKPVVQPARDGGCFLVVSTAVARIVTVSLLLRRRVSHHGHLPTLDTADDRRDDL